LKEKEKDTVSKREDIIKRNYYDTKGGDLKLNRPGAVYGPKRDQT